MKAGVTTLTVATGLPSVPRGTVLVLKGGEEFVVRSQTKSTLTLVPRRWWHKVPWLKLVGFLVVGGALALWYWWT